MVLLVRAFTSINFRRLCTASCRGCTDLLLLDASTKHSSLESIIPIHVNMFEVNYQLKELIKTGDLRNARRMFEKMPHKDAITWTNMISGYVNATDSTGALTLFSKMWIERGIFMDSFVLSVALKACGINLNVKYGESLHGYSVKSDYVDSVFVGSSLLDMYMKSGKVEEGCRVFDEMPMRNVVSWTAVITGLVRAGYSKEGLRYFSEMWRSKMVCDSFTFAIALKACADSGSLKNGKEIHTHAIKRGFDDISFVVNSLTSMYTKCGKLDYGLCLFERMSTRDVVSWTSIITTFVQMGQEEKAMESFKRMRDSGVSPNDFTFAAVVSSCASLSRLELGEQLHGHVIRLGRSDSLSVANSIITMYSKCGKLSLASDVFSRMSKRDIVSWSTLIGGYCQGGYGEEAFYYLACMRSNGPKPNEFAYASVLSVCGSMAILEQGKQVHSHVLSIGLEQTGLIQSSLINMYSKCGNIKEASKLFHEALKDDIVSWTAMINGYAEHGYTREAVNLFEKIPEVGLVPDEVTFIGVLTACSHGGFVDLGFKFFGSMEKIYNINPSKQHYGCMIDLLCRAGRLNDAENMIKTMPFRNNDDVVVWSTLLRASRVHGDVDCARRAADKILELDPNCAGTHITLANTYAAKGKWREVADVRMMMKSKGVIKEPGWSWIKIKDQVSAFVAGDRSHPRGEDIYDILELLVSGTETTLSESSGVLVDVEVLG